MLARGPVDEAVEQAGDEEVEGAQAEHGQGVGGEEESAALLVTGMRGRNALSSALLGSVSDGLVRGGPTGGAGACERREDSERSLNRAHRSSSASACRPRVWYAARAMACPESGDVISTNTMTSAALVMISALAVATAAIRIRTRSRAR